MDPSAGDDAEIACAYVADRVKRAAGRKWLQGRWAPPLACRADTVNARLFAEHRLYRIERVVATALVSWADGARPVDLLFHVPSARDVLAMQAKGRRCVSLLDEGIDPSPHADGLAFSVHDLCHLEKFVDPAHHVAQVGFFSALNRALDTRVWRELEAGFDALWFRDRDSVAADMNGSPIFLFAALKMKLKMAVRRQVGRASSGPLDAGETRAFDAALSAMLDAFDLRDDARDAAAVVSTRRDAPGPAERLVAYFEAIGIEQG